MYSLSGKSVTWRCWGADHALKLTSFNVLVLGPLALQALWAAFCISIYIFLWYTECRGKEGSCFYGALVPAVLWMYGQLLLAPLFFACLAVYVLLRWASAGS